jgi:hypothetical protein
MPTEVEGAAAAERSGFIRAPQEFAAGLALIAIALFAIWATSDLSQGTLRAMGPAMLPRWLATGVGLCGLAVVIMSLITPGEPLRVSDYSGILSFAAILAISAVIATAINSMFFGGAQIGNIFYYTFIVLYYGVLALLFLAIIRKHGGFAASGLRGPFFVVAGIIAFALTIRLFGLVIAGPLAMVIGGFATPEVREGEILIFAAVMTAFCVGLFRYLLNLPIPILIIPGFIHI